MRRAPSTTKPLGEIQEVAGDDIEGVRRRQGLVGGVVVF